LCAATVARRRFRSAQVRPAFAGVCQGQRAPVVGTPQSRQGRSVKVVGSRVLLWLLDCHRRNLSYPFGQLDLRERLASLRRLESQRRSRRDSPGTPLRNSRRLPGQRFATWG
jgi:hypothetical protein